MFRHAWQPSIGSLAEEESGRAVLRVGLQLVRNVRRRSPWDVMPMQFDRARAIRAAKLRVIVDQRLGDGLQLPEGFVSPADLESATFDLTLIDFFRFGGHNAPLDAALPYLL